MRLFLLLLFLPSLVQAGVIAPFPELLGRPPSIYTEIAGTECIVYLGDDLKGGKGMEPLPMCIDLRPPTPTCDDYGPRYCIEEVLVRRWTLPPDIFTDHEVPSVIVALGLEANSVSNSSSSSMGFGSGSSGSVGSVSVVVKQHQEQSQKQKQHTGNKNEIDQPEPIPLPAGVWLMLATTVIFPVMRRMKKWMN